MKKVNLLFKYSLAIVNQTICFTCDVFENFNRFLIFKDYKIVVNVCYLFVSFSDGSTSLSSGPTLSSRRKTISFRVTSQKPAYAFRRFYLYIVPHELNVTGHNKTSADYILTEIYLLSLHCISWDIHFILVDLKYEEMI